jgi:hypothetical protein
MDDETEKTAHTGTDEPHPAGDGPRSDRDVGGPTGEPDSEQGDVIEGGHGDRPSGFDPHE